MGMLLCSCLVGTFPRTCYSTHYVVAVGRVVALMVVAVVVAADVGCVGGGS